MKNRFALLLAFAIVAAMFARHPSIAQQQPDPNAPPDQADWTCSNLRLVTVPKSTYFHTTFTTTFAEMDKVSPMVEEMFKTLKEQSIDWFSDERAGYVTFIYKGVQQDRTQPFELSIGMTVPAGTKPVGKYEVRELDEFRSATALYNGPLQSMGNAYQKLFTDLFAAGHTPTDEVREVYLYWEGVQSNNNVVWIQAGLQ
jgi:effector-binding domain-containing protein